MGRLPYQVLVLLYLREESRIKYCVFERKDLCGCFQFIAGGGEYGETPMQTAVREVHEESGISGVEFKQLTSMCYIPTSIFSEEQRKAWGANKYVIPEYAFCAEVKSEHIKLSEEHVKYKWVTYKEALSLLKWDSNKTALYELNGILTGEVT
jgi:NTP pyrophosphohydrolases including oxidative damage repair enzymes